jgi:hypothetical protein
MTPTEKKYLLFLSARTPRPKSCDRPGTKTLRNMEAQGWIAAGPARKFGPPDLFITPHGEDALNQEEDKEGKERGSVNWCVMASMPEGVRVLVTDGKVVTTGIREGDVVHGSVSVPIGMWAYWAAFPTPPLISWGFGK